MAKSHQILTGEAIERIVAIEDAALRNVHITNVYHNLSVGMSRLLGRTNLSWCAFATWSSRTVGSFIRGEHVPPILHTIADKLDRVLAPLRHGLGALWRPVAGAPWLAAFVNRVKREIAGHVGAGNRMVFADIAPLFARMVETFGGASNCDATSRQTTRSEFLTEPSSRAAEYSIDRLVSSLQSGTMSQDGHDLLIAAFRNYYRAMFEPDPKHKAELILLANNQVGYHEQSRLQAPIEAALNMPMASIVDIVTQAVVDTLQAATNRFAVQRLRGHIRPIVSCTLAPIAGWLQRTWRTFATRWLMRLDLPERSLSLGQDLPNCCQSAMFPARLTHIKNPQLRSLLTELDFTPNSTAGSGAVNWADLGQRMNFIVDLFRTRQLDHSLYREPFPRKQLRAGPKTLRVARAPIHHRQRACSSVKYSQYSPLLAHPLAARLVALAR
ncbi:MAG: hypothetical protein MJE77_09280, partial [Proteobacteria bacterium]|nr:hypothetical protein [Pseudomonadota bacterium]